MRRSLSWVIALLAACSPNTVFVPVTDDARTLLIATQVGEGTTLRVRERSAGGPLRIEIREAEDRSGNAYVLEYSQTAAALEIDPEKFEETAIDAPLAAPIPSLFSRGFQLPIDDGEGGAPIELTAGTLPEPLRGVRFERRSPCAILEGRTISSPLIGRVIGLLEIEGREAAYVVSDSADTSSAAEVREVLPEGVQAPLIEIDGFAPFLAAGDARNYLWIAGSRGVEEEIWSGTVESGLSKAPPRPMETRTSSLVAIVGSRAPSPPVLFTLDHAGHLEKLENGTWSTVWSRPENLQHEKTLAWIAPNILYAIGSDKIFGDRYLAFRIEGSRAEVESVPSATGLTALAAHPRLGTLIGSGRGFVFRRDSLGWTDLGLSPIARQIADFSPYKDGFVVANLRGGVALWFGGLGYCPQASNLGLIELVASIVPFGDRAIVHAKDGPADILYFLTERASP